MKAKRTRSSSGSAKTKNKGASRPAETFMDMVEAFDTIMSDYDYSDRWLSNQEKNKGTGKRVVRPPLNHSTSCPLYQHLRGFVNGKITNPASPGLTAGTYCPTTGGKNRQVRLPATIQRCLAENGCKWAPQNVTLTWLVAYLYRNLPDTKKQDWQNFTLSHRCLSAGTGVELICLRNDHLVWEEHSTNLSRGYRVCRKDCTHCEKKLCVCQGIHKPCCI